MFSLIITVESIRRVAEGTAADIAQHLFQQYCKLVGFGLLDNKYSIPSLIWPPPYLISVVAFWDEV